ncbi:MAG: class I SAM-dependent RNA methyltransferase [Deltaproteobacteria bacterium]|nr:class I SAM-dependent RNA methyltransferase [Deltaproteobacteria bacterium]
MKRTIDITGLAYGGSGIGRINGKVVFVPFTAPGDRAEIEISSEKKGFTEGILKGLILPSPLRVEPRCASFGRCGGCALQHIAYPEQVRLKQGIFEETLKRIGGIKDVSYDPPAASPEEFFYRGRARFQVNGERIGFFGIKSRSIVEVSSCPVLDPLINETYSGIRSVLSTTGAVHGLFSVEIGVSSLDKRTVAVFHLEKNAGFRREALFDGVPLLKGLEVRVSRQGKRGGRKVFEDGDTSLLYETHGMRYSVHASVFSQANLPVNGLIVQRALRYAGLKGGERVLDLFSGAGNLTLPFAMAASAATGIESDKEAVRDAEHNASVNSAHNARFIGESAAVWLKRNLKNLEKESIDVVILDPPRGGDRDVAQILTRLRPGKTIYVSCSPPTLARDLSVLAKRGGRHFRASLFDMFPQTYHIEGIAVAES